jgi:hypothetical protein
MNRRGFLKTLAVAFLAGPALLAERRPDHRPENVGGWTGRQSTHSYYEVSKGDALLEHSMEMERESKKGSRWRRDG